MKLDAVQANRLIKTIDLADPHGAQTWKLILHGTFGETLHDNVNALLRTKNLYLTTKLAQLVTEKMK